MVQLIHSREFDRVAEAAPDSRAARPLVWGLTARDLHDAFWRSRGVQCVRRGQPLPLQRGAELFLLLEPCQLVLFDLATLSDRLTWRDATVMRLRLVTEPQQRYLERVVVGEGGLVERIERRYRCPSGACGRVMLTTSARIASAWMAAQSCRDGWRKVRRLVNWARIDHWRTSGHFASQGSERHERLLAVAIMQRWPHPDQAITGIEELEPGVWHVAGEPVTPGVRVGPLWLGRGAARCASACLIGPAIVEDEPLAAQMSRPRVSLKDIDEIEPPEEPVVLAPPAARRWYPLIKRGIDIAGSLFALMLFLPIMALAALCILIEDGRPLFFGHTRQGRGGRTFRCWKFRTMVRDAHKIARQLREHNICDGPQVFIKNDPRVTRVGRVLRALNLDELPQFWNVLAGHMSLVGPRPSPDDENQYCPAWRDLRLSVRPGITGLWQLYRTRNRGQDFQEWIKYDIEYVERVNFWLDLKIIIHTAILLLCGRTSVAAK